VLKKSKCGIAASSYADPLDTNEAANIKALNAQTARSVAR